MGHHHPDGHACACPHHHEATSPRRGRGAAILPILACAVCPGCVATYAKVLSVLGVGVALSETQHLWLLLACVVPSIGFALYEARTSRRYAPAILTCTGSAVLVLVHLFAEQVGLGRLSWVGVALLLAGAGWGSRARLERRIATPHVADDAGSRRGSHESERPSAHIALHPRHHRHDHAGAGPAA